MLHAKYECSSLYGLSQVDFLKDFLLCFYVKQGAPGQSPNMTAEG